MCEVSLIVEDVHPHEAVSPPSNGTIRLSGLVMKVRAYLLVGPLGCRIWCVPLKRRRDTNGPEGGMTDASCTSHSFFGVQISRRFPPSAILFRRCLCFLSAHSRLELLVERRSACAVEEGLLRFLDVVK